MVETKLAAASSPTPKPLRRFIERSSYLSFAVTLVISLSALFGHFFKQPILSTFIPAAPAMQPFTAIMFLAFLGLMGLFYLKILKQDNGAIKSLFYLGLSLFLLLNVLVFLVYRMPFAPALKPELGFWQAPSSQTLIGFLFTASALWALSQKKYFVSQIFALTVLFLALLMLFAYLTDLREIYAFSQDHHLGMSLPSTLNFILLLYCLLSLSAYQAFTGAFLQFNQSGDLIRKLLFTLLFLSFLLAVIIANLTNINLFSSSLRLALFGSLNIFLVVIVVWGFARQFNRLELSLAEKSDQAIAQNQELERLNLQLKKANETLKASETFLNSVLDNLSEMVMVFDDQNRYLIVNQKRLDLTKSERVDLLGKPQALSDFERFDEHMNLLDSSKSTVQATRASPKGAVQTVMGLKYPEGSLSWFLLNARLLPLIDGSEGVIMSFTDITELQDAKRALVTKNLELEKLNQEVARANSKLEHSEAFLKDVLNNLSEAVFVVDSSGTSIFANSRAVEFTGQTIQEVIDPANSLRERFFFDEQGERLAPEDYRISLALKEGQESLSRVMGYERKSDGQFMWLQANIHRLKLRNGTLGFIASYQDITDPIEAKKQLVVKNKQLENLNQKLQKANADIQKNEAFLNSILDNLAEAVFVVNQQAKTLFLNQQALYLTNQSKEEIINPGNINKDYQFFSEQGERLSVQDYGIVRLMKDRQAPLSKIMGYQRDDGRYFWLKANFSRVQLLDGSEGFLASYLDITEQMQARELLQSKNLQLEQSNKELQEFAFVASHDLQEPLLKIRAFIDRFSEKEVNLSERSHEYLRRMNNAALRMQTMINDILDLSRVSTRARAFERVDLNEILEKVKQELEPAFKQTQAKLSAEPLAKIDADPGQIERLFTNLLSNALKYRKPDESPEITITTKKKKAVSGQYLCHISIQDNGIGFDNEYRDKIFIMFQRLHGRTEYEGTGVGLAICRKIVERHGGKLEAFGEPGVGARFDLVLPFRQAKEG